MVDHLDLKVYRKLMVKVVVMQVAGNGQRTLGLGYPAVTTLKYWRILGPFPQWVKILKIQSFSCVVLTVAPLSLAPFHQQRTFRMNSRVRRGLAAKV
jgi:hypothetical protein